MRVNKVYPKNNIGILLADADCLTKFEDVYKPIISKAHNLNSNDLKDYTQNHFNINNIALKNIQKVDIYEKKYTTMLDLINKTEKKIKNLGKKNEQ